MKMVGSFEAFVLILQLQLTGAEKANGVAYAVETPVAAGTKLHFPGANIDVSKEAYLAFIDREPLANWGHAARYVLVSRENGDVLSVETRLPPFQKPGSLHWRVVYRAPSVPDAAVAFPQ
jgi:uncharacterized membrane protein